MILTSPSFENGANIPKKFTCDGGDINPELHVQNVPENAKSLALIMHDPDAPDPAAPRPDGFTHWVVWNISPKTLLIKEESTPPGSEEGANSAGKAGYMGPCPHVGTHRYQFRLYALDSKLNLPPTAGKKELEAEIKKHLIAETELEGLYSRQ
jgi:Raf kinase inhibitor-like YbhB/YbcL family protein